MSRRSLRRLAGLALVLAAMGCSSGPHPGDPLVRRGDEICAAGRFFHTGTKVVLWLDPGSYDAYRPHRRFDPNIAGPREAPDHTQRYGSFRNRLPADIASRVRRDGWTIEDLRRVVNQVVIHFDQAGTSKRCFEILHDIRGLSCHFLLDLDGTIYQTLDLKERAWHASQANEQSVGIEIANAGAYENAAALGPFYVTDGDGTRAVIAPDAAGALPASFIARPLRREMVHGRVQGKDLVQYDFTPQQYEALGKLLVTLARVFPEIKARVPRDAQGRVLAESFPSDDALFRFHGLVGHWHVSREKVDPGPAFDWDRVLGALHAAGVPAE